VAAGRSLTIILKMVLAIDVGLTTSPTSSIVETEPEVTVIVPSSTRKEALYLWPATFKVTRPSDIGMFIAAFTLDSTLLRERR